MNAIDEAIKHLETATSIIDEHIRDPKNYNTIYCNDFEIKSWELFQIINDIKYISNRYAVS